MSTDSSSNDTANIFKVTEYDDQYWETYLSARPTYSPDFYERIYNYHRSHSTSFDVAHDIGTGPGHVATTLAQSFNHVIASDVNATHLAVAQRRLSKLYSANKVAFAQVSGEQVASRYPVSSADIVVAAECMPLMDAEVAINGFASLLRSGGTLAVWFYGRPTFAEQSYAPQCQAIYNKIITKTCAKVIRGGGPAKKEGWKRATDRMASFLDDVALPAETWADVQRFKWNPDAAMSFYEDEACDFEVERISRVDEAEIVSETSDPDFWAKKWTVEDCRTFVSVNLPRFKEMEDEVDGEVEVWYKELEQAMGGPGAVRQITWPVVLILATRE